MREMEKIARRFAVRATSWLEKLPLRRRTLTISVRRIMRPMVAGRVKRTICSVFSERVLFMPS